MPILKIIIYCFGIFIVFTRFKYIQGKPSLYFTGVYNLVTHKNHILFYIHIKAKREWIISQYLL